MKIDYIPISSIIPNPNNIRMESVSDDDIDALATSISEIGLLSPIVVTPYNDKYIVMAGHRRLEAIKKLGWDKVPAVIRYDSSPDDVLMMVTENFQRKDLTLSETLAILRRLYNDMRMDIAEIANIFGRSETWTRNMVRLIFAPSRAIDAVDKENVSIGVILELIKIDDTETLMQWIDYAIRWGISISEAKRMVEYYYINRDAILSPNSDFNPEEMRDDIQKIYVDCYLCGSKIEIGDAKIIRICPNCLADL
ncbi:MAG: ParB/RepB/Spo0J family partition protein, partial [Candidatus Kapaibacteriota bacterium]